MNQDVFSAILSEEEEARALAALLVKTADSGEAAAIASTVEHLKRLLHGDLEKHFATEEARIFPLLASRGMDVEVGTALEQHALLRSLRNDLDAIPTGNDEPLVAWLRLFARALEQHVRFEANCLYVDLWRQEATELRAELDEATSPSRAAPAS